MCNVFTGNEHVYFSSDKNNILILMILSVATYLSNMKVTTVTNKILLQAIGEFQSNR